MSVKFIFGWIVALSFSFVVGSMGFHFGTQLGGIDGSWLALLLSFLSMGFSIEALKVLLGKQLFWKHLAVRDKTVFIFSMILLYVFFLFPIKEGSNSIIRGVSLLIGLLLSWATVLLFASEKGKKTLLSFKVDKKSKD
jgi:hypothetical protein